MSKPDYDLFDTQMAENILAGTHFCMYCGVTKPAPIECQRTSNLLCEDCAQRYDIPRFHLEMCERIRTVRGRRKGDEHWSAEQSCVDCRKYGK